MNMVSKKRQMGLTLITSLILLLGMTIIGVTAVRLSTVDLRVAHNYQQQLSVYQEAETKIQREVSFYRLHDWMMEDKQPPDTHKDSMTSKASVSDLERSYPCKGRSSLANSLGPDAPACKVFLFTIDSEMEGSGAKESHFKGAGKQFPNQSNGSYY